jgi:hypothetical protein
MLTGEELIAFVEANPGVSETDLALAAGYVRTTTTGKLQVLKKAFIAAVLATKGLKVGADPKRDRGKSASYKTSVHRNGIMLLGRTYGQVAGFEPGDRLAITVSSGEVRVNRLDEDDEELVEAPQQVVAERQLVAA